MQLKKGGFENKHRGGGGSHKSGGGGRHGGSNDPDVKWKYHANDIPPNLNNAVDNRSLYIDKYAYISDNRNDVKSKNRSLQKLIDMQIPSELYVNAAKSRSWMSRGLQFKLFLAARMIVNHTGGVMENAGIALDRFTGEPYIPGSAIKGIARVGADIKGASAEEKTVIFGYEKESSPNLHDIDSFAGLVAFLPAYPAHSVKLEMDILTCHYMDYYGGRKKKALDTEAPNPQQFPVVPAGSEFVFTIMPVNRDRKLIFARFNIPENFDVLAKARDYLETGLKEHGIGAKTAAGYGWFTDKKIENLANRNDVKIALYNISDYKTEEIFKNRVIKLLTSPGQHNLLKQEIEILKRPNNVEWLAKLKKYIAADKELRKQLNKLEWFPKEWLGL